jgi:pseudouridine synthase
VWVKGVPRDDAIQQLRQGVTIPSGTTAPAKVKRLRVSKDSATTKFEMVIHEGKKRQVRLMFKAVGHPVIRLKRVRIGNLRLGNLPSGQYRFLSPGEISELMLL